MLQLVQTAQKFKRVYFASSAASGVKAGQGADETSWLPFGPRACTCLQIAPPFLLLSASAPAPMHDMLRARKPSTHTPCATSWHTRFAQLTRLAIAIGLARVPPLCLTLPFYCACRCAASTRASADGAAAAAQPAPAAQPPQPQQPTQGMVCLAPSADIYCQVGSGLEGLSRPFGEGPLGQGLLGEGLGCP